MKIETLTLCDYAREEGGKFSVMGMYKLISTRSLPHTLNDVCFAIRIELRRGEQITAPLYFDLKHKDTDRYLISRIQLDPQAIGDSHDAAMLNLIIKIQGITFQAIGEYLISLHYGEETFESSFYVVGAE